VNPLLTIMALASRLAADIDAGEHGYLASRVTAEARVSQPMYVQQALKLLCRARAPGGAGRPRWET
jgi:hypothetical protein